VSGIETWERIRQGDFAEQDRVPALEAIRSVVQTTTKPSTIPVAEWQALQDLISSDEELADFITAFQWSVASSDYLAAEEEIKSGLVQFGYASDGKDADDLFERLFLSVFKRLSVSGRKRLTPEDLHSEIEQRRPIPSADHDLVGFIRTGLAKLEQRVRELEENVAQSTAKIEVLSGALTTLASRQDGLTDITFSTQEVFLDVPDLVAPLIPRQNAVDGIIGGLSGASIFSVVGEPGAGKTQLCLLVAQRLKRPLIWVSIPRDYSVQQASTAIDGLITSITKRKRPPVLRPWYEEAARALGDGLLVIDNLPRTTQGDPLARRIELLGELLAKNDRALVLISYYDLPRSTGEVLKVGKVQAPRLTDVEISDLLMVHGAPPEFAAKLTTLVSTATHGLPVLVAALARFFAGQDWELSWEQIQSVLKAEFAINARRDARDLIRLTVPDAESRELIYRLALTIGGFSRATVERIARVPRRLNLPNEKLEALTGVWVQPFVGNKFLLSPLIDHSVAADLDGNTRKGVHATLAVSITSQKVLEPLDVMAALFHFSSAGLVNPAALLLIQALLALTETDGSLKDEWGISNLWLTPLRTSCRDSVNLLPLTS
jgi:hypothetical protein